MMRHNKMRLDLRAATFLDPCGNEKYYAEKFYAAPDRHSIEQIALKKGISPCW